MHSSKLIEVFKVFEKEELEQLDLFINSPFFVTEKEGKHIRLLFKYLNDLFPDFCNDKLIKDVVYPKVFPNEKNVKGKLEKVMTLLLQTIKRFIIQYYDKRTATDNAITLARFYRQKKLDHYFVRTLDQTRKKQQNEKQRDKEYFFNQYLVEKEWAEYESFYNTRKKDLNLPSTLRNLNIFYVIARQEYSSRLLSQHKHQIPLNLQRDLTDFENLTQLLKTEDYLDVPLVKAYDQALRLLQNQEEKITLERLNFLLEKHKNEIPLEELKAMQALCRNYSVRFYNEGNREYLKISFNLYKKHLEEGFLYYNNGLLPSTIKNIVVLGLKLKKIEWVYTFLQKTKTQIVGTKHKKEVYHFNLACYYFAVEAYDEALRYLSETYEDWYYHIAARRLEIKIYYDTQSVLLDHKIEAFKIYIFRIAKSKLTDLQKLGNNHFADIVRQINAPNTKGNPDRIHRLIKRVKAKKVVADKEWIIEKLEELLNL